jgi:ATP-binding cassette, subfamily B, bacterial PglK
LSSIEKLRVITSRQDKIFLLALLFVGALLSLIETIGISAIMPFITLASYPDKILQNGYSRYIYEFFSFNNSTSFMVFFGVILIIFYIFRAIFTILYSYLLNSFSFGRYHIFAFRLFKNYVELPYKDFVTKNSSELTKSIVTEAANLTFYIQNLLMILSEAFTIIFLYSLLLIVNWKMTFVLTIFLGIKILFLTKTISKIIKVQGVKRSELQSKFYRILAQTFANFKILKFAQNESKIYNEFADASNGYAKANILNSTLGQLPRAILEMLGFGTLIGVVIYILLRYESASSVLPIISMYALALYRILPAINRILSNYSGMLFLSQSLEIVYKQLSYTSSIEGNEDINFINEIEIKNIYFEYVQDKFVLEGVSLKINKGEKLAFVGESGGGKSTLADLIMGICHPTHGYILVDGLELNNKNIRSWRRKIGYVPQSIYLFDGTIADNIAYGYDYDEVKIIEVLKKANIYDFLMQKEGIYTLVGEGGVQLSGGQKQRVGIARALYSDPEILVLDEATSALDITTEAQIMDEIYKISNEKTLLVIAHRLSTLEGCDRKITIKNGRIV